ncbi:MAG: antitoxin [Ornithinimicrobium sp.]
MNRPRKGVGETSGHADRVTSYWERSGGQYRNEKIMRLNRLSSAARHITGAMRTHQDKIERGIDKAGDLANQKTGSKHDQRIRTGTGHLRSGLSKITGNPSTTSGGDTPPGPVINQDPDDRNTSRHQQPGPEQPRT